MIQKKRRSRNWKKLPDELVFKLEHHPESFEAVTYHIGVYAKNDDETIVRATRPVDPFPKSIATPTLVSGIITAKYVNAVPLYRQEKAYEANDINISRATMANWVIKASESHLEKFYEQIKEEMMKQSLLHADETPFEVTKDGRQARSKSYMWVYRSGKNADIKAVLYDYCYTRGHANPEAFLEDFSGTLVCDGYGAYHQLENENPGKYRIAGCWVHLKRKFTDVTKAVKKAKGTSADTAVKKIQKIYHEEHLIEDLPPEEHLRKRKEKIEPLVDEFFDWIRRKINVIDSTSATGRGFQYALNQEKYLRTFLEDASIPLDNNAAEIAIRPFTVGRKNWVLIDTPKGARASAVIYSLVETAKANKLKVYPYIAYLLEELPKYTFTGKDIPASLLPWSKDLPKDIYK